MPAQPARTRDDVALEKLLLDEDNPRLGSPQPQDELFAYFAASPKTFKLATHIAKHGINPLELAGGVRPVGLKNRILIKEGNRRAAALRLLAKPALAGDDKVAARYRKLAKESEPGRIPVELPTIIFEDPSDALEWLLVKHGGELEGAGTVSWGPLERGRFNLRNDRQEQHAVAIRFLDQAVRNKWISEEEAEGVSITNLTRLVKDRKVQRAWHAAPSETEGLSFQLEGDGPQKLAKRLVRDWKSTGGKKVEEIYKQGKREDYALGLAASLGLSATADGTNSPGDASATTGSPNSAKGKAKSKTKSERKKLVPGSFAPAVHPKRVEDILDELHRLEVENYPNAVAVLFRTFIEASINQYGKKHQIAWHENAKLHQRAKEVVNHLKHADPKNKQIVQPINTILGATDSLFSFTTLHGYVHVPHWKPVPKDMIRHWDTFEPFLSLLWENA